MFWIRCAIPDSDKRIKLDKEQRKTENICCSINWTVTNLRECFSFWG